MSSTLKVDNIINTNDQAIYIQNGQRFYQPGEIVQKRIVRFEERLTVPSGTGDGVAISALRLTITPKLPNSLLHMQWTIFGEPSSHDLSFRIFLNGSLDNTTGWTGYNNSTSVPSVQPRTVAMFQPYETNYDSTPHQMVLNHMSSVQALGGIAEYYWEPAAWSNGANLTAYINSSVNLTGSGNYENGVSFGYIEEIAQ